MFMQVYMYIEYHTHIHEYAYHLFLSISTHRAIGLGQLVKSVEWACHTQATV